MNIDIKNLTKDFLVYVDRNSTSILTGLGISGMILSGAYTVKATIKATKKVSKMKQEEKTKANIIKNCWHYYIPPVCFTAASIACVAYANSVNIKRNAALATAYSLSEATLKDYQEKVIETVGKKKETEIQDSIAKDKMEKDPVSKKEIIITPKGETLCYESSTGRYFKSSIENIKESVNELNKRMLDEISIPLNDLYYALGLPETSVGYELGWNINSGYIDIKFSSQIAENGEPCVVLGYNNRPRPDYGRL